MEYLLPKSTQEGFSSERSVTIPNVGTASQFANGEVQVKFSDGSQLWIDGKHQIRYRHPNGSKVEYRDNDNIPRYVLEKMQYMPVVLRYLTPSYEFRKVHSIR